ncbi:MAG: tRNA-(ms[2]io[6]A)-hydroxylase [Proteobacteria bacterium]|nr:tRNA-(ms[2]io[6]A)-hydroxylase [Pseudomonadota bacterium]
MPAVAGKTADISHILEFLRCATPAAWVTEAAKPENLPILLVDHANLEHNAAQSALTTIRRYRHGIPGIANTGVSPVAHDDLLHMLSRLAREELRHFEQVIGIMKKRRVRYAQLSASRYAGELRNSVRKNEPGRLIDTLIVGSIIEARSCERFAALVPVLDEGLAEFYGSLLKSESRHFLGYLKWARQLSSEEEVQQRLPVLLEAERNLIESVDGEFRFHSGVPA